MATFTSTLPDDLLATLSEKAKQLNMPKNKLIEKALAIYLDQLNRAEYKASYQQMTQDSNLMDMAEEGMEAYLQNLDKLA